MSEATRDIGHEPRTARGVLSLSGTYRRPDLAAPPPPRTPGAAAVTRALAAEPTSFRFFQTVRLLERLRPDRAPVGGWADPTLEVARFGVRNALGFPASELHALDLPAAGSADAPARVTVTFLGLTGPQGVLPHAYTEHAAARTRARDTAFRDFLDLFHHRVLSLLYRAWAKHRAAVVHEAGGEDRLEDHLLDVAGLGTPALRGRLAVRDESLAFYAGVLARAARPADGLACLVADYFGVPARIEQFVGEWRRLDAGGQCTLGAEDEAGRLGFGVVGDAAWDPHARVRLRLGPLTRAQFDAFLPGGDAHASLRELARLYADGQVGVEAQLVLAREAVTGCALGATTSGLGRGSWLASRPMTRDPDDTLLPLC